MLVSNINYNYKITLIDISHMKMRKNGIYVVFIVHIYYSNFNKEQYLE